MIEGRGFDYSVSFLSSVAATASTVDCCVCKPLPLSCLRRRRRRRCGEQGRPRKSRNENNKGLRSELGARGSDVGTKKGKDLDLLLPPTLLQSHSHSHYARMMH